MVGRRDDVDAHDDFDDFDDFTRENRLAIEHYGRVPVLGEMPKLNPLTPERLDRWAETSLDADGQLTEFLI